MRLTYHGLHDLTIHTNIVIHLAIYGLAAFLSLLFIIFYIIVEWQIMSKLG